jgi:prepilin-type N-terminal cleavage/methylation domain-containing protein/prepilin-type processing-associated H-X9-DG protein
MHVPALSSRRRPAFTLIEIMVVIVVIAILLSILLPALAKGRESGRAVVCASNLRQLGLGFHTYADDYKVIPGTYHQGPINLDWCGENNVAYNPALHRHPFETSVLRDYLERTDRIMECPAAKRAANVKFDYTMVIRLAGARVDLQWRMAYPASPATPTLNMRNFPGIPLLIEEHDKFFNETYDDGSFAAEDQFSTRHGARGAGSAAGGPNGSCNLAYLDGSVGPFKAPVGGNDRVAENADLKARHLRLVKKRGQTWPIDSSTATEFGWANRPQN